MTPEINELVGLVVAALAGAAVGVERQWSGHAEGPDARFGGIRTFTLLGGLAGLAGWLGSVGYWAPAVVVLAGAVAIIVAGYVTASRRDVDATTEVSALVVLMAGLLATTGYVKLASGVTAITCLLLVEKSRLHRWVAEIDDVELRAGVRFAVMATVVLPLLPEGPFGPLGGIKPRALWALVIFFSGLSFVGYIARRAVGPDKGYPLAGALGGLISSTNVTITFAQESRSKKESATALAVGVLAASIVLLVRVLIVTTVLNRALAWAIAPYVVIPFVASVVPLAVLMRRHRRSGSSVDSGGNPLQLSSALKMALIFQLVLYGVAFLRANYGQIGLYVSGALLGLTDLDALTYSMAESVAAGVMAAAAAKAIVIGLLSNTVLKGGVAAMLGGRGFRWIATLGLLWMGIVLTISLLLL
jgi:uncharacterized membrane protein (DUF4010 family)